MIDFVPEDRVLHAGRPMIARGLLPASPASLRDRQDRAIPRAPDRGPCRDTWAVLVGGTTTVAPRAPAASAVTCPRAPSTAASISVMPVVASSTLASVRARATITPDRSTPTCSCFQPRREAGRIKRPIGCSSTLARRRSISELLKAAFVGRDIGRTDDTADSIVDRVRQSVEAGRHVFLLTPPGDYGLYLFLHLYDQVIAKATRTFEARLFLDSLILDQISLIEWRMKRKQVGSLNGACRVWLDKRATLGESVRVFDFVVDPSGNVDELVRRRIRGLFNFE